MTIVKKICSKCGAEKPVGEFHVRSAVKDGRASHCKACRHEANILNKEKRSTYDHAYYLSNKKNILIKNKKHYSDNKERINNQKRCHNRGDASYETYGSQLSVDEAVSRGRSGELLVSCTYCGRIYSPNVTSVRTRIEALKGQTDGECRLYCSEACKQACPSYKRSKHWKFQKAATSREVPAYFRQIVLKRDNWTCQKCGAGIESELHVHHIEGAVQQAWLSSDLENGITLCKACHEHIHSQSGCRPHELRCPEIDTSCVLPFISLGLGDNAEKCPRSDTLRI